MNRMVTASLSWESQCAFSSGVGDGTRYPQNINLGLKSTQYFCIILIISFTDFSKTPNLKLSSKFFQGELTFFMQMDRWAGRRTMRQTNMKKLPGYFLNYLLTCLNRSNIQKIIKRFFQSLGFIFHS